MRKSKDLKVAIKSLEDLLRLIEQDPDGISVDRSTIERAKRVFTKMNRGHEVSPDQVNWAVRVLAEAIHHVYIES